MFILKSTHRRKLEEARSDYEAHARDWLIETCRHLDEINASSALIRSLKSELERLNGFETVAGHFVSTRFGHACLDSKEERIDRVFEEACEFVQSEGMSITRAVEILLFVFKRPVGDAFQELGGLSMTLFAYARNRGVKVHDALQAEIDRVMTKPIGHFHRRQAEKAAAGLSMDLGHTVESAA